jgi:hypothetical protein
MKLNRSLTLRHGFGSAIALVVVIGALAACQTPQQMIIAQLDDNLSAAGFIVRPANTLERQAMLRRLPTDGFVKQLKGDTVSYYYADSLGCRCLYVGSQQAYDQYKLHALKAHLANEQEMTAQIYSYSAWNWNNWSKWGPEDWGPMGPEYSITYGPGW